MQMRSVWARQARVRPAWRRQRLLRARAAAIWAGVARRARVRFWQVWGQGMYLLYWYKKAVQYLVLLAVMLYVISATAVFLLLALLGVN